MVRAAHDGYAERFGIIHERFVTLSADGNRLDGEDVFLAADGGSPVHAAHDEFAVRFHLHPTVNATRLTDGHGVVLLLPNKEVWNFNAHEDRVELEESVYLAGQEGPRRTIQIVIYGRARTASRVQWSLQQANPPATASAGAGAPRARGGAETAAVMACRCDECRNADDRRICAAPLAPSFPSPTKPESSNSPARWQASASSSSRPAAPRKTLGDAGLKVLDVADLTGFPEMMDGRVKTLHPAVHGGLLAIRGNPAHAEAMRAHGIRPIDILVVNLYPFEDDRCARRRF